MPLQIVPAILADAQTLGAIEVEAAIGDPFWCRYFAPNVGFGGRQRYFAARIETAINHPTGQVWKLVDPVAPASPLGFVVMTRRIQSLEGATEQPQQQPLDEMISPGFAHSFFPRLEALFQEGAEPGEGYLLIEALCILPQYSRPNWDLETALLKECFEEAVNRQHNIYVMVSSIQRDLYQTHQFEYLAYLQQALTPDTPDQPSYDGFGHYRIQLRKLHHTQAMAILAIQNGS